MIKKMKRFGEYACKIFACVTLFIAVLFTLLFSSTANGVVDLGASAASVSAVSENNVSVVSSREAFPDPANRHYIFLPYGRRITGRVTQTGLVDPSIYWCECDLNPNLEYNVYLESFSDPLRLLVRIVYSNGQFDSFSGEDVVSASFVPKSARGKVYITIPSMSVGSSLNVSLVFAVYEGAMRTRDFVLGLVDGYGSGYELGDQDGYVRGYNVGFEAGRNEGYQQGYSFGYDEGFEAGRREGWQNGHDEGLNEGYNNGYHNGYEDGYDKGMFETRYGIWQNCIVDGVFNYEIDGRTVSLSENGMEPNYSDSGIDFESIWDKYQVYPRDPNSDIYLFSCTITIRFGKTFTYDSAINPIIKYGASQVERGVFYLQDGTSVPFDFDYNTAPNGGSILVLSDSVGSVREVASMELFIGRASDLLAQIFLTSRDNSYVGGYTTGYNKGLLQGREEGERTGYAKGYDEGRKTSYNEGYQAGLKLAENGNFFSLIMAVIDAPVSAFTSLLDFNILGFNMRSVMLSFLMTAFVIAVVRLFTEGKT